MQSANHIQVVHNKEACNVNKKTEKLVYLLLLAIIFSGVVGLPESFNHTFFLKDRMG